MALSLPPVPAGSMIRVETGRDGIEIVLPAPKRDWTGFVGAAFLGFWLCGWAAGENFALRALFGGFEKSNELERSVPESPLFVRLFLVGWLGFWTLGGLAAMVGVYQLLRPARAGRLTLSPAQLVYLPPRGSANPVKGRRKK